MVKSSGAIPGGYSACGGVSDAGWYGGVLVLEDKDAAFCEIPKDATFQERTIHCRHWSQLTVGVARRLVAVAACATGIECRELAAAERIDGPVCPLERTAMPVLAWIERRASQWHLMVWQDDVIRTVLSRNDVIRCPQVAMTGQGMLFAFEYDFGPRETSVQVVDGSGAILHTRIGRAPLLRAAGKGYVLALEQASTDAIHMRLEYFGAESAAAVQELHEGDYLFNADIAWSEDEQSIMIAAESSPCFGYGNQIGNFRAIHTWRWDLVSEPCSMGVLPVEERAFRSLGAENMPPIKPRVLVNNGSTEIFFKQHRFFTNKTFGWDLFACRREANEWSAPVRVTPDLTTPDTGFGLVALPETCLALLPAHMNHGGPGRNYEQHVDVLEFDADHRLDRYEIPEEKQGEYTFPVSYKDISPEPPVLTSPYEGRQLIWGDLHIHSAYSKCVSAVDGDPRENIHYVRDVLGCRVFAITEHTRLTTGPDSAWVYDRLETTAGKDNVILYASEPGIKSMRHTNWYARDRETFEKLERIIISHGQSYHDILRQVREDLPQDSVLVLRHFHGNAIPDDQILQHFDSEFEVAMEAMQGRCNAMIEAREGCANFPNQFLDAGCKIGLVGGTDHFRVCPNHFCLTGFWVKEVSAEGVWEAMRNRYTIAMSDSRVAMATTCGDVPMGSAITLGADEDLRIVVEASCARPIRRAALMRDGELLPWMDVDATTATIELTDPAPSAGRHWYVPTLEVETAYGDHTGICHASPYFVMKQNL